MTEEEKAAAAAAAKTAQEKLEADTATAAKKAKEEADKTEAEKASKSKMSENERNLLAEVMQKKEANKSLSDQMEALKTKADEQKELLSQFGEITPDQVTKMLQDKRAAEEAILEGEKDWESLKARIGEQNKKEREELTVTFEEKIKALEEKLAKKDSSIREMTIGEEFSTSSFLKDKTAITPRIARKMYEGNFETEKGKVVGYDKPAGSENRVMLVNGDGNPLSFDEAMASIIKQDPDSDEILLSDIKKGAGSDSELEIDPNGKQDKPAANEKVHGLSRILMGLNETKNE